MNSNHKHLLKQIIENGSVASFNKDILALHPAEIGRLLESLPYEKRVSIWQNLAPKLQGEILLQVHEDVREHLIEISSEENLIAAIKDLQIDEIADLDQKLPKKVVNAVVFAMDSQKREHYALVKEYPHDTAGGLMDVDAIAIRADITIYVAIRYLRMLRKTYNSNPEHLDQIYVVSSENKYLGSVSLKDLVSCPPRTPISQIMDTEKQPLLDSMPAKEVAKIFAEHDLLSAPVVSKNNNLLGRVTIDDVVDVIKEQNEELMMRPAGLSSKTDVFSPVLKTIRYRSLWLGINLINSFIAAFTINLFTHSIEKAVVLAVLMPVVASMGGVVGNQTLTLVTRGIAINQVTKANQIKLLSKEVKVGMLNGLIWAIVVAAIIFMWQQDIELCLVFGGALILSILLSATAGTIIPLVLEKFKIDPAIAGSVILVAFSDIAGFFIFLSIATIFLLQ